MDRFRIVDKPEGDQTQNTVRYVHTRAANTGAIMDARNAARFPAGHIFGHSADTVQ
jgi:hypothetical protein